MFNLSETKLTHVLPVLSLLNPNLQKYLLQVFEDLNLDGNISLIEIIKQPEVIIRLLGDLSQLVNSDKLDKVEVCPHCFKNLKESENVRDR